MSYTTFAAIDVGSSELTMKIYEISKKNGIVELDHIRHMAALGSDTYQYGKIRYELMEEVVTVLSDFTQKLCEYDVQDYIAYGTSAIREASNKLFLLDQIKLGSGLKVKVINNSEQRFLCYKALAFKEPAFAEIIEKGTAIVHSGAGSIQITLFQKGRLLYTQNIKLGSLRIRELLGTIGQRTDKYQNLIMEYITNEIETFQKLYLQDMKIENIITIGDPLHFILSCSKTLTPIMEPIKADAFYQILLHFTQTPMQERNPEIPLSDEEALFLLPTAMIYSRILKVTRAKNIYFSDITLCDGIAANFAQKKEKLISPHNFTNDIICSAKNIANRYRCYTVHNENVEYLALCIFDSIRKLHGFGKRERLLLQIAVILHNCGNFINLNKTRENSYQIIAATEILGLSHYERELTANIVRYTTDTFSDYEPHNHETYLKTAKLFAIFSIAHALDLSHKQKFKDIKVSFRQNNLTITVNTLEDITLEYGLFGQKASFFEEVYGIRPYLKQKGGLQHG